MKVGFLITGRMKSTRLPKKLTLQIFDREIIALMIDRLKCAKSVDEIIIATSTNPQDDVLEEIALREGVKVFRGSEEDVLERLHGASQAYNLDYMINITADCPLVSFDYIPLLIETFKYTSADLITSMKLPHGFFFYGIKPSALAEVLKMKDSIHTEVWGAYFTETDQFNCIDLNTPVDLIREDYRLTLDYQEDFDFFDKLYNAYGEDIIVATTDDIVSFLDKNPQIVAINKDAKAKYQKRWDAQKNVNLK